MNGNDGAVLSLFRQESLGCCDLHETDEYKMAIRSALLRFCSILLLLQPSSAHPVAKQPKFEVRLLSGPKDQPTADPWELSNSRVVLLKFKDYLGPDAITKLLKPDIDRANAVWHAILANSTGGHVPACAHVESNQLKAKDFNAWFGADTGDAHKMTGASPEHYVEAASASAVDGALAVDIIEAWGPGIVTQYRLPAYDGKQKQAYVPPLDGYAFQAFGDATLLDGTVFASVRNAFRDRPKGGIEALLCVWLPDSTPEYIVEGLRQHQAVEFTNWLKFAYRDISSKAFIPPA